MTYNIFNEMAVKKNIMDALGSGYTVEQVADEFTDLLNEAQKEYAVFKNMRKRDEATDALLKALEAFGEAYTGEKVKINADLVNQLGRELDELVNGKPTMRLNRTVAADGSGENLRDMCEAFYKGWRMP